RAAARPLDAMQGGAVQVGGKHDRPIELRLAVQVIEQLWRMDVLLDECASGAFRDGAHPDGLGAIVQLEKLPVCPLEGCDVTERDRETADGHAALLGNSLAQLVLLPVVRERPATGRE